MATVPTKPTATSAQPVTTPAPAPSAALCRFLLEDLPRSGQKVLPALVAGDRVDLLPEVARLQPEVLFGGHPRFALEAASPGFRDCFDELHALWQAARPTGPSVAEQLARDRTARVAAAVGKELLELRNGSWSLLKDKLRAARLLAALEHDDAPATQKTEIFEAVLQQLQGMSPSARTRVLTTGNRMAAPVAARFADALNHWPSALIESLANTPVADYPWSRLADIIDRNKQPLAASALHALLRRSDLVLEDLQRWLSRAPLTPNQPVWGRTMLMHALRLPNTDQALDFAGWLLKRGEKVNAVAAEKDRMAPNTALECLADHARTIPDPARRLAWLLDHGASIAIAKRNVADSAHAKFEYELMLAAAPQPELLQRVSKALQPVSIDALLYAIHSRRDDQRDLKIITAMLQHGAPVNARGGNRKSETPLHAAMPGQTDVARLLLEHGADPNAVSGTGHVPIDHARHNVDMLALLLQFGADPAPLRAALQHLDATNYLAEARLLLAAYDARQLIRATARPARKRHPQAA